MCSRGVAAGKITAPRRRGGEDFGVAASRRGHFKPEPDPEPEPERRNYRPAAQLGRLVVGFGSHSGV